MMNVSRSQTQDIECGEDGGGPGRNTALAVFRDVLNEGVHIKIGPLALKVQAHPEHREALFRLASGLGHVQHPGLGNELTASETEAVRRAILGEVEAHDRGIDRKVDEGHAHVALDPVSARVILSAFLGHCADGRAETTLRWCRSFPDVAVEIMEVASASMFGVLSRPAGVTTPANEIETRRRQRLVTRAQAILDAEAETQRISVPGASRP